MSAHKKLDYFDIGVVVPLEQELIKVMECFVSIEDHSTDSIFCHVVESGNPDIKMVVVQQQGMGKMHATNAANFLLGQYHLGLLVCLGIAGSLNDDMRLSFVCYSGKVADVLDNNKVTDIDEEEASDTEFSPTHYDTPENFTQAFGFMRTQPSIRPAYLEWQCEREKVARNEITSEVPAPGGKTELIGKPETMSGVIACGMVSKSEIYNKKLRKIDRAILAVETESGGVFAQGRYHDNVPTMAIRGISDYADKDKKKLENASKGAVRRLERSPIMLDHIRLH
jgi:nucleoside phosphorylase